MANTYTIDHCPAYTILVSKTPLHQGTTPMYQRTRPRSLALPSRLFQSQLLLTTMLALAALLPAHPVFAQANTAVLTCTAPTQNTDNSTIAGAQLPLKFKFFEGTSSTSQPNPSPLVTSCAFTFTGLAAGTHFFTAVAVDAKGATSAPTAPVSKAVVDPTPRPPSMLTVGADTFAYQIVQTTDQITLLAMGTAPAGTACDVSQSVTDAAHGTVFLIPYSSVILPNGKPNTKKQTVFAACG